MTPKFRLGGDELHIQRPLICVGKARMLSQHLANYYKPAARASPFSLVPAAVCVTTHSFVFQFLNKIFFKN